MSEKEKIVAEGDKLVRIKDGNKTVLANLVKPVEKRSNIDTNSKVIYLEFESEGRKVVKRLSRDKIDKAGLKKLTRYGADTWEDVVEYQVKYIRKLENEGSIKKTYEHSNVGFGEYDGKRIIKLYRGIGVASVYDGSKYNIKPKGDYSEWRRMVEEEVLGRNYLEFGLVVGFVSIVLNILSEEDSIASMIVNFCGTSSTGKTLVTKLALSCWGFPDMMDNGLLVSWFGTDQGIISSLVNNYGVPIGIDDTSLQSSDKDYTNIIYQIVNGQTKTALNIDGSNRERGSWRTLILSSSEESMLENTDSNRQGVNVRIIEVKAGNITESARNAEEIERVIMKNYGHAGVEFSEKLIGLDTTSLSERVEVLKTAIMDRIEGDSLSNRIAKKLALVLLTGELVKSLLKIDIDLDMLEDTLIDIEQRGLEKRDLGERAYESLIEYFQTNMNKFFKEGDSPKSGKDFLGKYLRDVNGEVSELRIPINNFKKIMLKEGYKEELVIKELKKKELLVHEKGKNTIARVFRPGTKRMPMYAIKIGKSSSEETSEKEDEKKPLGIEMDEENGEESIVLR